MPNRRQQRGFGGGGSGGGASGSGGNTPSSVGRLENLDRFSPHKNSPTRAPKSAGHSPTASSTGSASPNKSNRGASSPHSTQNSTASTPKPSAPRAPGGHTAITATPVIPEPEVEIPPEEIPTNASTKLFISNCPPGVSKEEVMEFFGEWRDDVMEVTWAYSEKGGSFMGYGWVDFTDLRASSLAQIRCNGQTIRGHSILVSFSQPKRQMDEDPPCEHKDWADWKRLRQKNGLQHFVCIHCGMKWKRATTQKKEQMAAREQNDVMVPMLNHPPPKPDKIRQNEGPRGGQGQGQGGMGGHGGPHGGPHGHPGHHMGHGHGPMGNVGATHGGGHHHMGGGGMGGGNNQNRQQRQQSQRPPALPVPGPRNTNVSPEPPSPITQAGSPPSSTPPSPLNRPLPITPQGITPPKFRPGDAHELGVSPIRPGFGPGPQGGWNRDAPNMGGFSSVAPPHHHPQQHGGMGMPGSHGHGVPHHMGHHGAGGFGGLPVSLEALNPPIGQPLHTMPHVPRGARSRSSSYSSLQSFEPLPRSLTEDEFGGSGGMGAGMGMGHGHGAPTPPLLAPPPNLTPPRTPPTPPMIPLHHPPSFGPPPAAQLLHPPSHPQPPGPPGDKSGNPYITNSLMHKHPQGAIGSGYGGQHNQGGSVLSSLRMGLGGAPSQSSGNSNPYNVGAGGGVPMPRYDHVPSHPAHPQTGHFGSHMHQQHLNSPLTPATPASLHTPTGVPQGGNPYDRSAVGGMSYERANQYDQSGLRGQGQNIGAVGGSYNRAPGSYDSHYDRSRGHPQQQGSVSSASQGYQGSLGGGIGPTSPVGYTPHTPTYNYNNFASMAGPGLAGHMGGDGMVPTDYALQGKPFTTARPPNIMTGAQQRGGAPQQGGQQGPPSGGQQDRQQVGSRSTTPTTHTPYQPFAEGSFDAADPTRYGN